MATATKSTTRKAQASGTTQVQRQLPETSLPFIRGIVIRKTIRDTVGYLTIQYRDPSNKYEASYASFKTWEPALLAEVSDGDDLYVEFSYRSVARKGKDAGFEDYAMIWSITWA